MAASSVEPSLLTYLCRDEKETVYLLLSHDSLDYFTIQSQKFNTKRGIGDSISYHMLYILMNGVYQV